MARLPRYLVALLLSALVTACAPEKAQQAVASAIAETQAIAAETMIPLTLQAQESVQQSVQVETLPEATPPAPVPAAPIATKLIVRWEITSPAAYARKYEGVICPGGASGPTIGVGYDLGHQTRATIAREWAGHPQVADMQNGAGVIGEARCAAFRAANRHIRVKYADAERVFQASTLPSYTDAARRALRTGWELLPPGAQAANISLGYNRGWSMKGDRNREKRAIRDECVPATDRPCQAAQLRAMCRLWDGTPNGKGLCARRGDEARVTLQ